MFSKAPQHQAALTRLLCGYQLVAWYREVAFSEVIRLRGAPRGLVDRPISAKRFFGINLRRVRVCLSSTSLVVLSRGCSLYLHSIERRPQEDLLVCQHGADVIQVFKVLQRIPVEKHQLGLFPNSYAPLTFPDPEERHRRVVAVCSAWRGVSPARAKSLISSCTLDPG